MSDQHPFPASIRGLSERDAQHRLDVEGYNELPSPDRRTPLRIVLVLKPVLTGRQRN
jgi:Ca2+-transporting ATPase